MPKVDLINYNDSRFFTHCRAVKLEISEKNIISEISQMEMFDERIYILDKKTASLHVFDNTGHYIQSISNKGNGPGEYLAMNAFYIHPQKKTLNIFDPLKMAVHQYNLDGSFIESVRLEELYFAHIKGISFLNDETLFCFTNPTWYKESGYFILNSSDYSLKEKIYQYPILVKNQISFNVSQHPYSIVNNEIHFISPFSNVVQSFSDGKTHPVFYIENGKPVMPDKYLKIVSDKMDNDYLGIIINCVKEDTYNVGYNNYFETERFICVEFYEDKVKRKAILFDKKNNTGIYIEDYTTFTPDFGAIVYSFGETLVKIWNESEITSLKEEMDKGNISREQYSQNILDIIDTCQEEDNPVLLFYTMQQ
jgi:hypothetical protein